MVNMSDDGAHEGGAAVLAVYMIPGPSTMRTAERSLVARLMRSPMRWAW